MRCVSPWVSPAVVVAIVCTTPAPAAAEKDPRKAAIKLIGQGDRLFKKGDHAGALAKYQEAFQIFPSPKIFYAMAKAEEKLGRTTDAIAHFEQFLAEAGDDVNEDLRVDAQVSIQELERTLAVVTFDIGPAGVTVFVDDAEVGVSPLESPVRLPPGEHTYRFTKPGFETVEKRARLAAGDRLDEPVTLREDRPEPPVADDDALAPAAPPRAERSGSDRIVLWTGVGVTGLLAAGWIGTGLNALKHHDEYTDTARSPAAREDARRTGRTWALTSDALLVGTLVAGGFTAWWYFGVVADADDAEDDGARATVFPYVDPAGGGGLAVQGAW